MNFETLKFMLNKIIANANVICNSYENSTFTYRIVIAELTDVLSCAFDFKPTFSLNESKRLINVSYNNEIYTRTDKVTIENFGKYVLELYHNFNTNK